MAAQGGGGFQGSESSPKPLCWRRFIRKCVLELMPTKNWRIVDTVHKAQIAALSTAPTASGNLWCLGGTRSTISHNPSWFCDWIILEPALTRFVEHKIYNRSKYLRPSIVSGRRAGWTELPDFWELKLILGGLSVSCIIFSDISNCECTDCGCFPLLACAYSRCLRIFEICGLVDFWVGGLFPPTSSPMD